MVWRSRALARALGRASIPRSDRERLDALQYADAGHGYDVLGFHPDWLGVGLLGSRWLYERYFRVKSYGAEAIPASGGAILAANHSGTLPFDAVMLFMDVFRHTDPPRIARPIVDLFVPRLPFVSTFFSRVGAVSGNRATVRRLLELGELIEVFPEGTPGIGKPFSKRYQLETWRVGHAELAIRHRVPVVPIGIVGPEEQWPQLARIERFHPFGAPYVPIPATPIPLPVRYHIHYGAPIRLHDDYPPDAADDPTAVDEAAQRVKGAVQDLLDRGVRDRPGVFV